MAYSSRGSAGTVAGAGVGTGVGTGVVGDSNDIDVSVKTLAVSNTISGVINIANSGTVTVGTVDGVAGIVNAGTGSVSLAATAYILGDGVETTAVVSGGNINLQLPKDAGVDLDIRGSRVSTTGFSGFSGQMSDRRIDGKLNGGGTAVTADCGGNVSLSMK